MNNPQPQAFDGADDPFAALGVARSLDVTPAEVSAAHLRASARVHPDRARDAVERDRLLRESAVIGNAKRVLQDPVLRAEALLRLAGVPASDVPLAPAFLMETLELREAIEAAVQGGDPVSHAALRTQAEALQRGAVAELRAALALLATTEPEAGDAEAGRRARAALARLRYASRMVARLDEAL